MSNRFGRNQKRRMRAELAALQAEVDEKSLYISQLNQAMLMDRALLRQQSDTISRLRDALAEIADEIGHQSALLGVKVKPYHVFTDGTRLQRPERPPIDVRALLDTQQDMYRTVKTDVMRLLRVSAVADRMKGQIHLQVELADGAIGYAISEGAIRNLTPQFLERTVAPEIARGLVDALRKHKQQDRRAWW